MSVRRAALRGFALVALVALLDDASACLSIVYSLSPQNADQEELAYRAPCPCGCAQHSAALAGLGLSQFAAPPSEVALAAPPRALPVSDAPRDLPNAPPRAIDHVPIASA
jgi:hypothetical protein